jgi:hypothetical protein
VSCGPCRHGGCGACGDATCVCACHEPALVPPSNPPGQSTLGVRLGDQRDFFAAALHGLSDGERPALRELGTRELDDPTIAFLDAWSVAADVLTFYRERLTNDGYLRTTTDETALRELVALVGFEPRPGVAATAHLAYLLDKAAAPVEIPLRAKAQTVPAPGEQMQTFETDEKFVARAEWSQMAARTTRPAKITLVDALLRSTLRLSDTGLFVRPGERVLFVFENEPGFQVMREVASAKADIQAGYVELQLKPRLLIEPKEALRLALDLERVRNDVMTALGKLPIGPTPPVLVVLSKSIVSFLLGGSAGDATSALPPGAEDAEQSSLLERLRGIFKDMQGLRASPLRQTRPSTIEDVLSTIRRAPIAQLASRRLLSRDVTTGLNIGGDDRWALLRATTPEASTNLSAVLDALPASEVSSVSAPTVYLMRTTTGAFGAMAPPLFNRDGKLDPTPRNVEDLDERFSFLDNVVEGVQAGSLVVFDRHRSVDKRGFFRRLRIARVLSAQTVAREGYGISGKATRLELVSLDGGTAVNLSEDRLSDGPEEVFQKTLLDVLRNILYFVQSEAVTLAGDAETTDVFGDEIELQFRVDGLEPGQSVIVAGERTDILDANNVPVPRVRGAELAMIGSVAQRAHPDAPGDTLHTLIGLVKPLAYSYLRSSVTVYGNVIKASHGETLTEVLGSGDASRAGQRLALKRGPLTFVTAPSVAGVESSELIRVNGKRYQRVASLLDADANAHAYQLDVDAGGGGTLSFGGARLPSGQQNVRANYRVGIGSPGNVKAEQISLLTTRPLGVTGVLNPLRASGGADRDGPERIRRNAPLAARALAPLSRCVSVADYAALARRFAGIGHAEAVKLSDGAAQVVHVTLAGVDDIPLDLEGELLGNLRLAFAKYGDPSYPVEIAVRELKVLVLQAKVAIEPDASWDFVEPVLRRRLLDTFGIERRRLAQSAYLSEAVAVIQGTAGVAWVDVDTFGGITENEVRSEAALALAVAGLTPAREVVAARASANRDWKPSSETSGAKLPRFFPAQLAVLLPEVTGLLALNPI